MALTKSTDQDYKQLLSDHKKVFIKFYADWCGSCKLIAPKVRRLSEDENFSEITFLDINAEENPEVRKWAGVSNLPFFIVANGGEILNADSTSKIENVEAMLNELKEA